MYNAVELKELTIKPKINDITLEILREFYEMFLYPFIYTYTITRNDESKKIAIRFNTYNFCHLLGIESVAKNAVKFVDLHNYRGEHGWNNIKNGVIDIKHLKQLNKKITIKVMPPTNIDCELLFYSTYDNAVIHLGLEKDSQGNYYIPRTFFVEKLGKAGDKDIYIDNQEQIEVKKENRIIMI